MKKALLLLLLLQDLPDRARIEASAGRVKVSVDGVVLFDGPGTKAAVAAVRAFEADFVTVTVDGEERVRLWASQLSPLNVPDPNVGVADALSLRTQPDDLEETVTLSIVPTVNGKAGAPVTIWKGKFAGTPSMTAARGQLEVTMGGTPVFRGPRRRPEAAPAKHVTVADFVERLNAHRRAAGAPEVKAKAELTRACDLHALYLVKNLRRPEASDLNAHKEEPSLPGYTAEGADAAPRSVIHFFGARRDVVTSVDSLMATFYHRMKLIEPRLTEVGVGWAFDPEGVAVVVIHCSTLKGAAKEGPVVYPGDGQKEVPVEFGLGGREVPDPVPDPRAAPGYPITLQWDEKSWQPRELSARVSCDGKELACWVSTPEKPARGDLPQPGWVSVIPKEALKPGRTHTVEVRCRRSDDGKEWSRTWSFSTGR